MTIVRIFPLEDYKNTDSKNKEVYNLGIIYIDDNTVTRLEDTDDLFKWIPEDYNSVVYTDQPTTTNVKSITYCDEEN